LWVLKAAPPFIGVGCLKTLIIVSSKSELTVLEVGSAPEQFPLRQLSIGEI
jgi:hypothetical protein